MSFFFNLLFDLITTITTIKLSLTNKTPKYILGSISIVLSGIILLIYFAYQPPLLSAYYEKKINYTISYFASHNETASIVLETEADRYLIDYPIWSNSGSGLEFIKVLNKSTQATVWLKSKDGRGIMGIKTPFIDISPTVGAAEDESNWKSLLWLSGLFFVIGAFLIIVVYLSDDAID